MGKLFAGLKGFDAYAKTLEDFRVKTSGGGIITVISGLCIVALLVSEFTAYLTVEFKPGLTVDKSRKQKLAINMNITFPKIPCYLLSVDVMDISGEHQDEIAHDIFKSRLDKDGIPKSKEKDRTVNSKNDTVKALGKAVEDCGSCYGGQPPASGCCNTCDDVRQAYKLRGWSFSDPNSVDQCAREGWSEKVREQAGEGCNVHGRLELNRVAGNFHIAPGSSFSQGGIHVHDFLPYLSTTFDFSHTIHHLSFGDRFEGAAAPLNGFTKETDEPNHMFTYFVKVIGTSIWYRNGDFMQTNQFAVTHYERKNTNMRTQLPGFFVNYEISPLVVTYRETQRTLSWLVTGVCSIVGGIFTVAGIVDSVLYRAEKTLRKKMQLGKAS